MTVRPVHRHDVRVSYPRQLAGLVQNAVGGMPAGRASLEQLQSNGMIEPCIVRVVHLAEATLADFSTQDEVTPTADVVRVRRSINARGRGGIEMVGGVRRVAERAVDLPDFVDHLQQGEQPPESGVSRELIDCIPVYRRAVSN